MGRRELLLFGASALALTSCGAIGGGSGAALDTYDFTAPSDLSGVAGRTSAQILVREPSALKVLDSDRLVVRTTATAVTYMPDVRIGDQLPKVLQAKLAETLENTNRVRAVGKPGEGLLIDFQLVSDLRAFEVRASNGGFVAYGEISAKLVDDRNGKVRSARVFKASRNVSSGQSPAMVNALDRVFDEIARDLTGWILQTV